MDPELSDIRIADVVMATAGREKGKLFYVLGTEETCFTLETARTEHWKPLSARKVSMCKKSFALRPESPKS